MIEKRRQSSWKRVAAIVGLLSLLCFWTAVATHIHDVARQGGVQQDCQLCVAGNTSHALQPSASVSFTFLPLFESFFFSNDRLSNEHGRHSILSRAPPVHS